MRPVDRTMGTDAARAVGRFRPDGAEGYRAAGGGPLRATRAEAEEDERLRLELHQARLCVASLRRKIKRARKYWALVREAGDGPGVSRIGGRPVVGDLPPRTLPLIAAQSETEDVARWVGMVRIALDRVRGA